MAKSKNDNTDYPEVTKPVVSEYNGNKVLALPNPERPTFPFRFGISKAKMIVDNISAIEKFVKKYG